MDDSDLRFAKYRLLYSFTVLDYSSRKLNLKYLANCEEFTQIFDLTCPSGFTL